MEQPVSVNEKVSFRALLSLKSYRYLIFSQFVSNMGDGVYRLALIWLMKVLTESPLLMSILLAAETIPLIIFGLFAGVFVDRGNKKRIMVVSHLLRAALILCIVLLFLFNMLHPAALIIIAVLLTTVSAFFRPALTVAIRTLVPEQHMTQAQSLSQMIQTIVSLAAPALAAGLIAFGMEYAFILNVVTYLLGALIILWINEKELVLSTVNEFTAKMIMTDLKDGIYAITKHDFLRNCMIYFTILNFLTAPETILLPLVVTNVTELAMLEISFFIGILLGSLCVNYLNRYDAIIYICCGISLFSIGIGMFAFGIPLVWQVICVFVNGIGSAFVNIKMSTLITLMVPKEVLGRASSLISVMVQCAMPVSVFLVGLTTGLVSIFTIFGIIGGAGLLVVVLMLMNPHLRMKKEHHYDYAEQKSGGISL
ncbi:MFS transporter [Bacillus thuringiensis]|nr:MFS transporter [Bacillus thuringiensis]